MQKQKMTKSNESAPLGCAAVDEEEPGDENTKTQTIMEE
jgi:hypothetical protein